MNVLVDVVSAPRMPAMLDITFAAKYPDLRLPRVRHLGHDGGDSVIQEVDVFDWFAGAYENLLTAQRQAREMQLQQRQVGLRQRAEQQIRGI